MAEPHRTERAGYVTANPTGDPTALDPPASAPSQALLVVATDPDPLVAGEILSNYDATADVVDALARAHADLTVLAAGHPNAPVALKGTLPVREHSDLALDRYVQARGGTGAQRVALLITHRGSTDPLAVVWDRDVADPA